MFWLIEKKIIFVTHVESSSGAVRTAGDIQIGGGGGGGGVEGGREAGGGGGQGGLS